MTTLLAKPTAQVCATGIRFSGERLIVALNDGRELTVPYKKISWLKWLAAATPKQRTGWTLEPGGHAVYWSQLDDGFEVCHLLGTDSLA
jgi:hypothetical protein